MLRGAECSFVDLISRSGRQSFRTQSQTSAFGPARPRSATVLLALSACLVAPSAFAGPAPETNPDQSQVRYQRTPAAKPKARTEALDQRLEQAKQAQQRENETVEQARAEDFHRRHHEAREQQMVDNQGLLRSAGRLAVRADRRGRGRRLIHWLSG
jgi:hypothetical protein